MNTGSGNRVLFRAPAGAVGAAKRVLVGGGGVRHRHADQGAGDGRLPGIDGCWWAG